MIKHRFWIFMALTTCLAGSVGTSLEAESSRDILAAEVPKLLAQYSVPSVSIAVIKAGEIEWTAAYGWQAPGIRATPDTLYNLASLTKPLTAEVVLRLISAGSFNLDEAIAQCWSDPDIATDERRWRLTPRIIMSHQTGFPNWRDPNTGLRFLTDPGSRYGYSGEGYEALAHFAECRTGKTFPVLAQEYLFDPAGMKSTSYSRQDWFNGRVAIPADDRGHSLKPQFSKTFSAADLVYATAGDYARFMSDVLKDQSLTPVIAVQRSTPQVSMMAAKCTGEKAPSCPLFTGMGLGWQILRFPAGIFMMHNGKDEGVSTFVYLDRTTKEGLVILTNGENGAELTGAILEAVGAPSAYLAYIKGEG